MVKEISQIEPERKRRELLTMYHSTAALAKLMAKRDCV